VKEIAFVVLKWGVVESINRPPVALEDALRYRVLALIGSLNYEHVIVAAQNIG